MRAAEMNGIALSGTYVHEILCEQALCSFIDENLLPILPFSVLSERIKLMNIDLNQASDTHSMQGIMRNTPPHVDVSTYKDRRRDKTRTREKRLFLKSPSSVLNRALYRPDPEVSNSQIHPLDTMYGSNDVGRTKILAGPISEEDQKEDEKQPKPGKLKPEKPKPERKGDKGSRRVKRPKVRGVGIFSPPKE